MKVLFLTKYGDLAASTRYRFSQYLPSLRAAGIVGEISPLLGNAYLEERFSSGRIKLIFLITALFRRARAVFFARNYDLVVVYGELFPYLPPFFELILRILGVRYLYDFDDAFFHQYDMHRNFFVRKFLGGKIGRIIKWSSGVIAGNDYLASYARRYHENVTLIPTVVDMTKYERNVERKKNDHAFTVGWIGSPSTSKYALERAPMFRQLSTMIKMRLVLIGAGTVDMQGVDVVAKAWSEATEIEELSQFDVGIMPLTDDPWARGKCGFKLIQYLASGVPVVASPVGVNSDIIKDGDDGYLATTDAEWIDALKKLNSDPVLRQKMGACGLEKARARYSLQSTQHVFKHLILKFS
jgi:glycosyltransferase involved in cell wall biosynthesis